MKIDSGCASRGDVRARTPQSRRHRLELGPATPAVLGPNGAAIALLAAVRCCVPRMEPSTRARAHQHRADERARRIASCRRLRKSRPVDASTVALGRLPYRHRASDAENEQRCDGAAVTRPRRFAANGHDAFRRRACARPARARAGRRVGLDPRGRAVCRTRPGASVRSCRSAALARSPGARRRADDPRSRSRRAHRRSRRDPPPRKDRCGPRRSRATRDVVRCMARSQWFSVRERARR